VKLAAIDIGSNAIRLLIEEVREFNGQIRIDKVSLTRVPVRLGEDVFTTGRISEERIRQLVKTMRAFWYIMDVHQVEMFRVCATSAMREAKNRKTVIETVEREANFKIEILSGEEEADLIFSNYFSQNLNTKNDYLFIDVGGGSTELTLIRKGKRIKGKSFNAGTVRALTAGIDKSVWKSITKWLSDQPEKVNNLIAIGTGGNVNTLFKLQGKKPQELLSITEIKNLHKQLVAVNLDERIFHYKLRPDRADVIIPACEIYLRIMELAGIKNMIVPKIGLSDGMILHMAEQLNLELP
jgi:exopolyphosphatase/guanosine-5'-triphosphate,3'-diphosphate pyrophosphatase